MPILKVLDQGKVPVKIWTNEIEAEAEIQLAKAAQLPFVFKHIAVMPDVHAGRGSTIGSVIATKGAIIPATVGVDLGCGMMAVKTPLDYKMVQDKIKEIRHSIERSIPVGFNSHKPRNAPGFEWEGFGNWNKLVTEACADSNLYQKARNQLGTLGGGNHFIEICLDLENNVWVMLHSGSRNIGKVLADIHINEAKGLMKKYFIDLEDKELAYLVRGTPEYDNYIKDLMWAQEYAMENRRLMMNLVLKDLSYSINNGIMIPRVMEVNCHHNYVSEENHYGENVLVTRKGAVRAREGELGIIPGSMGARSFIVKGRGNADSFCSCSHGAGRKMSRTRARATFTESDLVEQTSGVECRKDEGVLDEIPGAYKDIAVVMANQSDLVEVVAELKQIMCIKG